MSANVGPYIANLQLRERAYEFKTNTQQEALSRLSQSFDNLSQTMFALQELHTQQAKDKAETLTAALKMYGGSEAPQSLWNEWGGSVEVATGSKKPFLPRDPEGNIVPSKPDALLDPQEKAYLRTLTPEKRAEHFARQFGDLAPAGKENELMWKNVWEGEKIRVQDTRNAIMAARNAKGAELQQPSGWIIGENGAPRRAKEDEQSLTYAQIGKMAPIMNWTDKGLKDQLTQARIDAIHHALNSGASADKIALNVMGHLFQSKNYGKLAEFWDTTLRPRMLKDGIDMGPAPDPPTLKDQVKQMLGYKVQRPSKPEGPRKVPSTTKSDIEDLRTQRDAAIARSDYDEVARIENLMSETQIPGSSGLTTAQKNKMRADAGLPPM